eukprot:jgi/Hompol1/4645/HPOL_003788-RA
MAAVSLLSPVPVPVPAPVAVPVPHQNPHPHLPKHTQHEHEPTGQSLPLASALTWVPSSPRLLLCIVAASGARIVASAASSDKAAAHWLRFAHSQYSVVAGALQHMIEAPPADSNAIDQINDRIAEESRKRTWATLVLYATVFGLADFKPAALPLMPSPFTADDLSSPALMAGSHSPSRDSHHSASLLSDAAIVAEIQAEPTWSEEATTEWTILVELVKLMHEFHAGLSALVSMIEPPVDSIAASDPAGAIPIIAACSIEAFASIEIRLNSWWSSFLTHTTAPQASKMEDLALAGQHSTYL